jgi:hypothetical protein
MTYASRSLSAALVAALGALYLSPTAQAQPRRAPAAAPPVQIPGGGTELFRAFLDREGIEPVRANTAWIDEDTIVVVFGTTAQQPQHALDPMAMARQAIQNRGAVLIASESPTLLLESDKRPWPPGNEITQINGASVTADPHDCHQPEPPFQHRDTPYVVPVSPDERLQADDKPGRVWGVFRGLGKIATNDPSYINNFQFRNEFEHPLARLPKSSRTAGQRFPNPPLFAVGGDGPPVAAGLRDGYSFLVVADASAYINQMVMEPGTDNLEFALRTVEYLQGPDKTRKRCLFFENGQVVERFDGLRTALAKPKPKIPPEAVPNVGPIFGRNQEALIKALDERADRMQAEDWAHRTAVGTPGSAHERNSYADWIVGAAVLLAIRGAWLLLARTWAARQPLDVPPAPNTGAGAASTGPPGVFERRQRELVRRNNLYEPVRNLMREFFESAGAPPAPGPRLPPLTIDHRAVRKPESLRQALRDMWRLAYGPPTPISAQRWFELEPYFNRLRRAHADGKWRFVGPDEM